MSLATADPTSERLAAVGSAYLTARARAALPVMVAIWIFSGGFVLFEPSPYEFIFLLVVPVAILSGIHLYRGTLNVFNLLVVFAPFAAIAAFQPRHVEPIPALAYVAVTLFLWFTAYVVANYVAEDPIRRMRGIIGSYTAVAVIVAIIGTLAYLGLMPWRDLFLRYDRAKATFQDPNVYGPFLILPAIFAAQKVFLDKGRAALIAAMIFGILFVGVFVSFSRGAWGHLFASALISFVLIFTLEARAHDKARMLLIAIAGAALLMLVLAALLSINSVRELFLQRFNIAENYDTGATGRFGRQSYAFDLALANPWGIGPNEFAELRIVEDPHNTYVKVLLTYGWGGGLAYFALIGTTLWRAVRHLVQRSPNRPMLIALTAVYVPLLIESAIIDIDHWRHFFLITGLIWGVTAVYPKAARRRRPAAAGP